VRTEYPKPVEALWVSRKSSQELQKLALASEAVTFNGTPYGGCTDASCLLALSIALASGVGDAFG